MADVILNGIRNADGHLPPQGNYIVLLGVQKIPHLLVVHNGAVFSISSSGRQSGSPLEKLLLFITRKKIPTLFVEWKIPGELTAEKFRNELQLAFSKYPRVIPGKISCLFPIRDAAAALHGGQMRNARFIFELLPLLEQQQATGNIFSLNLDTDGTFRLKQYDEEELHAMTSSAEENSI